MHVQYYRGIIFAHIFFLTSAFYNCGTKTNELQLLVNSQLLAGLYCEAKFLRIQRFELADQIRFAEDSLSKIRSDDQHTTLILRLDSLQNLIEPLAKQTKALADSIHATQQGFYQKFYNTKEKRTVLDQAFQKRIQENCPD